MKKILSFVLLFTAAVFPLKPAEFSIAAAPSYGSYYMQGLRNYQEHIESAYESKYDLDFKTVDDFPGGFFVPVEARVRFGKNILGLGFQQFSTGSRTGYKDYSGRVWTDFYVDTDVLYLLYKFDFNMSGILDFKIMVDYNMLFSTLRIEDYSNISLEETTSKDEYECFSHTLTVGTELTKRFGDFELGLRIAYMVDLNNLIVPGYFELNEDRAWGMSRSIRSQWGGFRAGLVFAYNFTENSKIQPHE